MGDGDGSISIMSEWKPDDKICEGCGVEYTPPVLQQDADYCKTCFKKTLENEHYESICHMESVY